MASNQLAKLVVALEAESSKYQSELEKARRQLGKFDSDVSKIAAKVGKAVGAGIAAAATGVAFAVKQSLDAADELGNLSEKVGASVEELSKLQYAAKLSDVSAEQLQQGLIKLSKSATQAAAGTGDALTAFQALGVELKKSDGTLKSTDELFTDVAQAFSTFEDGPEKAAAAMAIFGKSGAELIPLLNQGKQGITAFGKELEKLGGVVTAEAAANADEFNRNLDRLKAASGGLANQLATQFSPALVDLTAKIVAFTQDTEASTKVVDGIKVAFRGVAGIATVVGNVFQIAGDNIAAVAAGAMSVARGDFAGAVEVIRARAEDAKKDLRDIVHAFDETKPAAKEMGATATAATTEAAKSTLNYAAAVEQAKNKTKEAKDITDAWALSLMAASEIQDEVEKLEQERKDTQSRQDDLGLTAASEIEDEIKAMDEAEKQKTEILEREAEIRRQIQDDQIAAGIDALGYAAEASQALGKKGFKAFKAFAIAQTTIDTFKAAQATYASLASIPYVGPALGAAGAAAAVAAGLARVGQIRSLEPSGYETGGLVTGGRQLIEVNEAGTETVMNARATSMFTPELAAMNEGRTPWDHARVEAANDSEVVINNNAPGIQVIRRDGQFNVEWLPEIASYIAADIVTGRGTVGRTISDKFGVQGRQVR